MSKKFTRFFVGMVILMLAGCQTMSATGSPTYDRAISATAQATPLRIEAEACYKNLSKSLPVQELRKYMVTGRSDALLFDKLSNKQPVDKEFVNLMIAYKRDRAPCTEKMYQAYITLGQEPARLFGNLVNESNENVLKLIRGGFETIGQFAEAEYRLATGFQEQFQALRQSMDSVIIQEQAITQQQRAQSAAAFTQGMQNGFNQMHQLQQTMNQNSQAQRQIQLQQQQMNQGTNCSTKYNPYSKSWDTVCR